MEWIMEMNMQINVSAPYVMVDASLCVEPERHRNAGGSREGMPEKLHWDDFHWLGRERSKGYIFKFLSFQQINWYFKSHFLLLSYTNLWRSCCPSSRYRCQCLSFKPVKIIDYQASSHRWTVWVLDLLCCALRMFFKAFHI